MKLKVLSAFILSLMLVLSFTANSQSIPDDSLYLGQTPPGDTPEIFAPGIISRTDSVEERLTFSNDGKWLFFNQRNYKYDFYRMMYIKYDDGHWTNTEKVSFFNEPNTACNPSFSPDGKKLLFDGGISDNNTYKPYVMELINGIWTEPITINIPIPAGIRGQGPNITDDSTVYFSNQINGSTFDIYKSKISNGEYSNAELVIKNSGEDCFVTKDNGLIIFNSYVMGRSDFGSSDLYITFHKNDGNWTNPKNLGSKINTNGNEYYPTLSPDNRYLLFTRWNASGADIYWVSAGFIDSLKHTNFIPYVKKSIPSQTAIKDSLFYYQIPDSTFIDDDGNNTLRYTAALSNGNPLPVWLSLDSVTCVFSGTPDTPAIFNIKVTATDTAGASVSSSAFILTVSYPPLGVGEGKDQRPKGFMMVQNYPNPFNPSTTIRYSLPKSSFVKLTIYNTLGQKIQTLKDSYQSAGEHSLIWDATDEKNHPVSSGIYFCVLDTKERSIQKKMLLLR